MHDPPREPESPPDSAFCQRKHPHLHRPPGNADKQLLLLTVCTRYREPALATPRVHENLVAVWLEATAWRVGRYVILPDHLHLFASPGLPETLVEQWVGYWKRQFTRRVPDCGFRWAAGHWSRSLRTQEHYAERWEYVRQNPVRHGLVQRAEDWPYQGEVFKLEW